MTVSPTFNALPAIGRPSAVYIARVSSIGLLLGGGCSNGLPDNESSTYRLSLDVLASANPAASSAGDNSRKYVPLRDDSCSGLAAPVMFADHAPPPAVNDRPIRNNAIFSWVL